MIDWPLEELELALVIVAKVKRGRRKMVLGLILIAEKERKRVEGALDTGYGGSLGSGDGMFG